jgi:L-iditol 2-dehydrogenase
VQVAYFTGPRELEIRDDPRPSLDRPGDVLLRIDRVGVCGSDVHYYVEGGIGRQRLTYPATLGHECSATVVEAGPAVERLGPGQRVAVDPAIACGRCDQCRRGRANTCRNLRFMGCPGEAPGAAAEYYTIPAENCFPIPDTISLDEAALVEPLSIGLHAVGLAGVKRGLRLGILGAGPIGLGVLLCARASRRVTSYVTDLLDERLAAARRCGADWTANAARGDVVAQIAAEQPEGLDVVFECSGDPACIDQGQEMLTPGGALVLVGIPPSPAVSFDVHTMRRKELVLRNVRRQNGCVGPVIRLMEEGKIDAGPLLTHRLPLGRIGEAFEMVAAYGDGVIKAMLQLSSAT